MKTFNPLARWLSGLALALACAAASAQGSAAAADVPEADSHAARSIINSQLKALEAGRATQAFAHATPAIQAQFQNADAFLVMVKRSYPMLIQPRSVSFYRAQSASGAILQGVKVRDRDGNYWRALYELQQVGGTWRINGCVVAEDEEEPTS